MENLTAEQFAAALSYPNDYQRLAQWPKLAKWLEYLPAEVAAQFNTHKHGHLMDWYRVLHDLPHCTPSSIDLQTGSVRAGEPPDCDPATQQIIYDLLQKLHPWRKGPFLLQGVYVDTEWRSDWKWERLQNHISPLKDRFVLDVGCGNGYHCWRMVGAGAQFVLGIDPTLISVFQFHAARHFLGHQWPLTVLPIGIEAVPPRLQVFDTVFSMGVLYHRRSPIDHLLDLRGCLRHGGELVLETLVIEGEQGQVLVPQDRYAQMRNVWFIPSCPSLELWLQRCGFHEIRVVNVCDTTVEEQRRTEWMRFHSLSDALNAEDHSQTIEGLPAPKRAIICATAR